MDVSQDWKASLATAIDPGKSISNVKSRFHGPKKHSAPLEQWISTGRKAAQKTGQKDVTCPLCKATIESGSLGRHSLSHHNIE